MTIVIPICCFFLNCSKNLDVENFTKFEVSISILRFCQNFSRSCEIGLRYNCSNPCTFRDMTLEFSRYDDFMVFSKKILRKLKFEVSEYLKFPTL